ncbi:flagellar hook-basal body complex protein FliE [Rickettsiales endosymbiont of Trichoplax sp. H2]|uniref:flagellar hook-basal body complex protein FliE n=1 Tax=Rickettsiales endosymbiont of Trichoplax sp. H2 TaxID=2021221 RepID=UPI0012B38CAC|nr:flagellar hook-basal body complex protein FliE [Rickettsiales endosymbiont of Trichoplax sp. H2]MSO13249.1 Flagellar hook-basal body complex protein FliE [Rickettsiales endosymbiont of Trichoplax sp. H2]
MTTSSIKATYNQAVDAYKRTNKNIKTTGLSSQNSKTNNINSGTGVLYSGDKIDVLSQGVSKAPQFSTVIQELIKSRVQKVKSSEKVSLDAIKGKAGMIEVMAAVNDSEVALQEIVTVRDKIVGAYLDILKMPL